MQGEEAWPEYPQRHLTETQTTLQSSMNVTKEETMVALLYKLHQQITTQK